MIKLLFTLLLGFSITACFAADQYSSLHTVIDGKQRSAEHKARDQYRHPQQTLEFFEVQNDMTVVEIWPGAEGWYTEILAPYLSQHGRLYAAHFSEHAAVDFFKKSRLQFVKKMQESPEIYDKVILTDLQPPESLNIAPDNSADRVLTFRNVHNWMRNDQAPAVFKAMFKALKPGGILGVVEHRASTAIPQDPKAVSGYVREDYLMELAKNAGFEFLAKSEMNANSRDTKDYSEGVWTLPPSLRLMDSDRQKYLSIGESDRMTLKFRKPE